MSNSITKQSYFIKRLRDSGYMVEKLDIQYTQSDPREWTVIIDPGNANVFCTLYRNANPDNIKESKIGDFYFELYDGGQFLPPNVKYKTMSIEVLISYLVKYGINNKSPNYTKQYSLSG